MKHRSGMILAEILIALSVIAIVGGIVAQLTTTNTRLSQSSESKLVALQAAEEALEVLRAITQGNDGTSQGWNRMYQPPDGTGDPVNSKGSTTPYRILLSGGVWQLAPGEETLSFSETNYQRKILIENVCRDNTSGTIITTAGIPPCTAGNSDDPATQKITVSVTATSSPPVLLTVYLTRYLNEATAQTNWNGGISAGPFAGTSTLSTISVDDPNIDRQNANCGPGQCIRLKQN